MRGVGGLFQNQNADWYQVPIWGWWVQLARFPKLHKKGLQVRTTNSYPPLPGLIYKDNIFQWRLKTQIWRYSFEPTFFFFRRPMTVFYLWPIKCTLLSLYVWEMGCKKWCLGLCPPVSQKYRINGMQNRSQPECKDWSPEEKNV